MNIILCGLPGVGKTTYGKMLAVKLNWSFIETDKLVELFYYGTYEKKLSCRQIFEKKGENKFRKLEEGVLSLLENAKNIVLSLGGGIVSLDSLKDEKFVIHLQASNELLLTRILEKGPPPYLDKENIEESFLQIAAKREPFYKKMSQMTINTDLFSDDEIVNLICNKLPEHGRVPF